MKPAFLLMAAFLSAGARAEDASVNRELCRENTALDHAVFAVLHAREGAKTKTWTLAFHHCAQSGRELARPMEVQRVYTDGAVQALSLTTQLGSLITTARLHPARLVKASASPVTAELGPFFTSDLLGGDEVTSPAARESFTIRRVKPAKAAP